MTSSRVSVLLVVLAVPVLGAGLSHSVKTELARVEEAAKRSRIFRALLAENDGIERSLEPLPAPDFVLFLRGPRRLAYDPGRLKLATEWQVQTATARELAKASIPLPVELVEAEAAAWVRALDVALELAQADQDFSKDLARRAGKAKAAVDARASMDAWTRIRSVDSPAALPADELDRLALFAGLLAHGPDRFYEAVGQLSPLGSEACRLSEVADFLAAHGAALEGIKTRDGQVFTVVGGLRYPTRVVRAAKVLQPEGGVEFAREALGALEADAQDLSKRLRVWLKWPAP